MSLLARIGPGLRLTILACSVALAAPQAVTAASPPAGSPPPFPDRGGDGAELARESWIVRLVDGVDPADAAPALARAAGGRVGLVYEHAIRGFQLKGSAQAADAIGRNPRVLSVEPDRAVTLTETVPFGVQRIDAFIVGGGDAYAANFRGKGARIAVIDTGMDLDHPDLEASIDAASGYNCVNPSLAPDDGHGHGTHVSGTAAAPLNGGDGVVGVAPEARLVPFKSFDDVGGSSEALVLCGLDHVVALNTDGISANDIDVVNMSWGDPGSVGACAEGALHAAICAADATGAILVAGAGNDGQDGGTFVPAAFPEVIGVSALADFDGSPGGSAGCAFVPSLFWYECDDTLAFFSNFGASIDAIAPGVNVYSTWTGGGYQTIDGTSMATPHVAGIAALMAAAHPGLTPAEARAAIQASGECPNGQWADADAKPGCAGQGSWPDDPDGIPEVLPNALRAAQAVAAGVPPNPTPTPTPGPTPTPTPTPRATPSPSPSPSPSPTATVSRPSAPTLLGAPADGTAILSWTVPTDEGGSAISGYRVYRRVGPGSEALLATTGGSETTYIDQGLANGTSYTYRVSAVNVAGEGAKSNAVTVVPAPSASPPGAPQALTAKTKGTNPPVTLRWSAPVSDGGSPIATYFVYRQVGGTGAFAYRGETSNGTTVTFTDAVERGTTYAYYVTAWNAYGESAPSNTASARVR